MGKILFPKYFPSCPTDGTEYVVEGQTNALRSGIAETMKLFWRPKKIKLSGSYFGYNDTTNQCDIPGTFEFIIQSPYGSEEEMICEPYRRWTIASQFNTYLPLGEFVWDSKPYTYDSPESLFTLNEIVLGLIDPNNPDNTCSCRCSVFLAQRYPEENYPEGQRYDWQTVNICGVSFNVATYVDPDRDDIGYIVPTVEVTEWWSYGGTYNTSTGEPL
jgi:hypothetical protein